MTTTTHDLDATQADAAPPPQRRRTTSRLTRRQRVQRFWASFDAAPQGRRIAGTAAVGTLAAVITLLVAVVSTSSGWSFAYADAQSHLTIARRIFDSLAPGFTQLGTVWLPLPNILLIPFTANLTLWASGWSAALLGALCMAATTAACYRIAARLGLGRTGRLITVFVLVTNPSLLYVHTTGLSEPVLLMFMSAAVAGLASWATAARPMSAGEIMVFCGAPAAGAVLSRYEGWALLASGTLFVIIVCVRRGRKSGGAIMRPLIKSVVAFAVWPMLGMAWWLAYNFVVYGDPLEFMRGQYSAAALQAPVAEAGLLAYQGHIGLTLWSYHWAVIGTAGGLTLLLAALGLVIAMTRWGFSNRGLIVLLLATGWAFSLLSLYLGQTHMNNMHTLPQAWWNNRYALVTLPWLAVLVGVLADSLQRAARRAGARERPDAVRGSWGAPAAIATSALLGVALLTQATTMARDLAGKSAVLAEAQQYMETAHRSGASAAAQYLHAHWDGGRVLMDESAAGNALAPQIGIPLKAYVNRATGALFDEALQDPASHADWVFFSTAPAPQLSSAAVADLVYGALLDHPAAAARFETVFTAGNYVIARRIA